MAKKKHNYQFNPETLSFERVENTAKSRLKKVAIHTFTSSFIGFLMFLGVSAVIDSPEEIQLQNDLTSLELQYNLLDKKLDRVNGVLNDLAQRDNNLYRVIFQADPISDVVRTSTFDNNNRFEELTKTSTTNLLTTTSKKLDEIEKQLYIQINSYDEIEVLLKTNAEKLQYIPAIQPILNKDLTRIASGYGWRMHPIYRIKKKHEGMDFTANTGTDIYATGNGKVIYSGWKQGYGNTVIIDHGFGYKTLYAHMSKIKVKEGQEVKRADIIGLVGSTGVSSGPHLHYEVRINDVPVNPLNYYFLDLSPEEYDRMIQIANNAGNVMS
ncbi:MAG: M23 family metallopeptidase [bacterium]